MSDVHLGQIDLNLLRVFDALAEERSATRAGQRLGLSQSAISHALRRLRGLFGDPLFLRGPDGMRPTPRAAEIAPNLREALVQLQLAIGPSSFVPELTDRRFTVAAGPYITTVLMPAVMERMRAEAPHAEIRVRALDGDLDDQMRSGVVDLAVGAFSQLSEQFGRETLFEERAVWALRAGHPAANAPLTLEGLAALPQIVLSLNPDTDDFVWGRGRRSTVLEGGDVDQILAKAGLKRRVALRVGDIYGALSVVSRTDLVVQAPRRLARLHAVRLGLQLMDPPYPARDVPIESVWSRREAGAHPSIDWLRSLLRDAAGAASTLENA